MNRRMPRTLALAIAAVVLTMLTVSSPAHAAKSYTRSFSTYTSATNGYATATIKLTFHSKRKVTYTGTVDDKCPADGRSAKLQVRFSGKGTSSAKTHYDSNTCGKGAVKISGSLTVASGKTIQTVVIALTERNISAGTEYREGRPGAFEYAWANPYQ